jgi:hypothetical protein
VRESAVKEASDTIRKRLDSLGVRQHVVRILNNGAEAVTERFVVDIPGAADPDRIARSQTA